VVGQLGTRRPWRQQGIASALLSRFLATTHEDGYQQVALGVDADNPTGTLGLYERHGFRARHTFGRYVLPV
jgi:mycothiol synthase